MSMIGGRNQSDKFKEAARERPFPTKAKAALIAAALTAVSCASTQERGGDDMVELRGTLTVRQEFRLSSFEVIRSDVRIPETDCISGIFQTPEEQDRVWQAYEGKRVRIAGQALRYADYIGEDIVRATVGRIQNGCGNEYVIIAISVDLASD